MRIAAVLMFALSLAPLAERSNSDRETATGQKAFAAGKYAAAAAHLSEAHRLRPSAASALNAASAIAAAGDLRSAKALFDAALGDPALRFDAHYNRGTAALAAGELEAAVVDLEAALRARPSSWAAKRNLEIALRRRAAQCQISKGGRGQGAASAPKEEGAAPQNQAPRAGDPDLDQILRSVQQQEREELSRMKGTRRERVGW